MPLAGASFEMFTIRPAGPGVLRYVPQDLKDQTAAAPPTISEISCVMDACRALL